MYIKNIEVIRIPKEVTEKRDDLFLLLYFSSTKEAPAPNGRKYQRYVWTSPSHLCGKLLYTKEELDTAMQSEEWKSQTNKWDDGRVIPEKELVICIQDVVKKAKTIEEIGQIGVDSTLAVSTSIELYDACMKIFNKQEILFDRKERNGETRSLKELMTDFYVIQIPDGRYIWELSGSLYHFPDIAKGKQFMTEADALEFTEKKWVYLGDVGYEIIKIDGMFKEYALAHLREFKVCKDNYYRSFYNTPIRSVS